MTLDRRQFLTRAAGGLAAASLPPALVTAALEPRHIEAVAFDAFPIFDPRPVFALAEALFPEKGAELSKAWFSRQFEYQWLRALSGRYADFWQTSQDGLMYAARLLRVDLTADKRDRLMQAHLELEAWPDVPVALRALKDAGIRLAFLSNMTAELLEAGIRNSRLEGLFEQVLSTDAIKAYKPEPRAYQLAVDALDLHRESILFAAFAGWDVAGARWFGYPTFWVNRLDAPIEELGVRADARGHGLADLASLLTSRAHSGKR
jgi:2-haloacid dehalogenase